MQFMSTMKKAATSAGAAIAPIVRVAKPVMHPSTSQQFTAGRDAPILSPENSGGCMESGESGIGALLIVAVAFVVAKVLAMLGILTRRNADTVAKLMAVALGVAVAVGFEAVRSMGPVLDFIARIGSGVFVGVVCWVFILMGIGAALGKDE